MQRFCNANTLQLSATTNVYLMAVYRLTKRIDSEGVVKKKCTFQKCEKVQSVLFWSEHDEWMQQGHGTDTDSVQPATGPPTHREKWQLAWAFAEECQWEVGELVFGRCRFCTEGFARLAVVFPCVSTNQLLVERSPRPHRVPAAFVHHVHLRTVFLAYGSSMSLFHI